MRLVHVDTYMLSKHMDILMKACARIYANRLCSSFWFLTFFLSTSFISACPQERLHHAQSQIRFCCLHPRLDKYEEVQARTHAFGSCGHMLSKHVDILMKACAHMYA